ncbi:hypothetical protein H6G81_02290 [Scytonema hofmannii FACHB-248]|uniref:CRISPR-associated protein n=1 Tax=Scytonema hofmannii FACHB-248 TaxID=1842502 RepID=A0ABR8GJ37_9CYAN|nr:MULTISPECIES: hypothetical protein [Nostocales]MBD2603387.1 hypothetical protein [Scytonema hofmannii FACHB-248]
MSIWIVTTGNSDVILKDDKNWGKPEFYQKVRNDLECKEFSQPDRIDKDKKQAGYTAPARVLGRVYENHSNSYDSDLDFPLLNTFREYFKVNNIILERVIVLLTNQENIFEEEQRCYKKSPYWQDTLTLKPILEWFFREKVKNFNLKYDFLELAPTSGQGLDHWNETYKLVANTLENIKYNPSKPVYISHQAGTPAISSAVQFVGLNKFKKVKFVLSNQYYDIKYNQELRAEEVEYSQQSESPEVEYTQQAKQEEVSSINSEYWRGIQIQKAKQLITSGFPGAALKMLDGIERIQPELDKIKIMVNFFNLYSVDKNSSKDFEIDNASQRIVDSLELISFFFNQNNYLQGISLLAAAQETFLKVAIIHETAKISNQYRGVAASKLIRWTCQGLFLINDYEVGNKLKLTKSDNLENTKNQILTLLNFPVAKHTISYYLYNRKNDGALEFTRFGMLEWLRALNSNFKPWAHLGESDLRNQIMHNLRGVEDSDVIEYLLGYPKTKPSVTNVMETYHNHVKTPFLEAIDVLKLPCDRTKLRKRLQEIVDSLV